MKKILLVCGAGMSTSLLVKKMKENDREYNYQIKCCDVLSAKIHLLDNDILLLAPHISYMKSEFEPLCKKNHVSFMVIDILDYTRMDGGSVLKKAQEKLYMYEKENPFHVVLLHNNSGAMSDLLLLDMNKKRKDDEKTWLIESIVVDWFENKNSTYHVLLLEPQIRFEEKNLRKQIKDSLVIINVPPMSIYTSFDGRKMLDYIHKLFEEELIKEKIKAKEGLEKI